MAMKSRFVRMILTVAKKPSIDELFARVRNLRGAIPKGYAFDREQANGR